ncbi:mucin-19-like [Silurus asotus]|uniref:Mucin-19-like n=1 Tax=Silurus asotus TaxID=30991 RepID=A0AAD5AKG2_SILAS|nr:mucin-19-like [Silurus asotus]
MQTFNNTTFHVKSTCLVILTQFSHAGVDCLISVQRDTSGVMKKVEILVNKIATVIEDGKLTVEGDSISLPYDHTYQSVYAFGIYTRLKSKVLPFSVTWYSVSNAVTTLWVQLDLPLMDEMNGICGRLNSSETRAQLLLSNVIRNEMCVIDDPQPVDDMICKEFKSKARECLGRDKKYNGFNDLCKPNMYTNVHQAAKCSFYEEFLSTCSNLQELRNLTSCREHQCPGDLHFNYSGTAFPPTCSNPQLQTEYQTRTCLPPDGLVLNDRVKGYHSVKVEDCPCVHRGNIYAPGEKRSSKCQTCKCINGKWTCSANTCPTPCVIEGWFVTTLDGKQYSLPGKCTYVAARGFNWTVTIKFSDMIIEEMYLDVHEERYTFSLNKVQLRENTIAITDLSQTEYVTVYWESSMFVKVQTTFGMKMQVQVSPEVQMYLYLPQNVTTAGLCGSKNNNTADDFTTSSGIVENSAQPFALSWALGECMSNNPPVCINTDNELFAEDKCSQLTNTSGVFAKCHDYVPVNTYFEACVQRTCHGTNNLQVRACVGLGNYAKACASQGIIIGDWREETACIYSCDSNLKFDYAMQACNHTCRSLSGPDPTCDMSDDTVEGCGCLSGTHLNIPLRCSPRALCHCSYPGGTTPAGPVIIDGRQCMCENGNLQCSDFCDCPHGQICVHCAQAPVDTTQRTCESLSKPFNADKSCISGCYCPEGQYADHTGSCVIQENCTCEFSGIVYASGQSVESNCKTCTCSGGKWNCEGDPCPGVCEVFGNGQYKTFDSKWYRFDGHCQYTLVEEINGLFSIKTESVPCCDEVLTCSRAISVKLKDEVVLIMRDMNVTENLLDGGRFRAQSLYSIHTVGLYIIISVPKLGLTVIWDKQTKVKIELHALANGKVRGLCGDFDGKLMNDLLTSSSTVVFSTLEFGNSWKTAAPPCSDVTQELFPCERHSYCAAWAQRRCMILHSDTFQACHLKVDPTPYYQACILESCSCDFEGKFLGFCTAVAAYADACTTQNVCIKWRTPDLCPVYCDYYNEEGQCSWHYEACAPQIKTCGKNNNFSGKLEGCYPRCPAEMPFYDENRRTCSSLDNCTCFFNNTVFKSGICTTATTKNTLTTTTSTPLTTTKSTTKTLVTTATASGTPLTTTSTTAETPVTTLKITPESKTTTLLTTPTTKTTITTSTLEPTPLTTTAETFVTTTPTITTIPQTTSQMITTSTKTQLTTKSTTPESTTKESASTTPLITTSATTEPTMTTSTTETTTKKSKTTTSLTITPIPGTTNALSTASTETPVTTIKTPKTTTNTFESTTPNIVTSTTTETTVTTSTTDITPEKSETTTSVTSTPTPKTEITTPVISTPIPTTTSAPTTASPETPVTTTTTTTSSTLTTTLNTTKITSTTEITPGISETTTLVTSTPIPQTTSAPTTASPETPVTTTTSPKTTTNELESTTPIIVTSTSSETPVTTSISEFTTEKPTTSTLTTTSTTTEITSTTEITPVISETTTLLTSTPIPQTTSAPTTASPETPVTTTMTPKTTTHELEPTTPIIVTSTTSETPVTTSITEFTTEKPTTSSTLTTTLTTTEITSTTEITPVISETTTLVTSTPIPQTTSAPTTASPETPVTTTTTPKTTTHELESTTPIIVTSTSSETPVTTLITEFTTEKPTSSSTLTTTSTTTEITSTTEITPVISETTTLVTSTPIPQTTSAPTTASPETPVTTTTTPKTTTHELEPTTPIIVTSTSSETPVTTSITEFTTEKPTSSTLTTTSTTTEITSTTEITPVISETTTLVTSTPIPQTTSAPTTASPETPITTTTISKTTTNDLESTTPIIVTSTSSETPVTTLVTEFTTEETTTKTSTISTTQVTEVVIKTGSTSTQTAHPQELITTVAPTVKTPEPTTSTTTASTPELTTKVSKPTTTLTTASTEQQTPVTTATTGKITTVPKDSTSITKTETTFSTKKSTPTETPVIKISTPPTTVPTSGCKDLIKNQTWPEGYQWKEDCFNKICINSVIELRPLECPTPVKPVCPRGMPQLVKDEQGCCETWQCDCQCDVFGDPHYTSFAGQNYDFLENCTYILVEERTPRQYLSIIVDNYYCEPFSSCAKGIILKYQNNTVTLQVLQSSDEMPVLETTLNQVTIKPPYRGDGLRFESTDAEVYIFLEEIRSYIFLSVWNTLKINLAMEHFFNNTQGQCGVCGSASCVRRNGSVENEDCCDKTAYEWIVNDPFKPYCQQAPRHVPCIPDLPPTTPTPISPKTVPPCVAPPCDLLRHELFWNCSKYIDVENLVKSCKFDYCSSHTNTTVCSPLESLANKCNKMGICVPWRNLTNGICDITCPEGMIFDECRSTPTDYCRGGNSVFGMSIIAATHDRISNEFIRGTAHVGRFGDKVMEAQFRWLAHVQSRDMGYIGRRMLRIELPGRRKRGRPRRRFMDVVREDMQVFELKEADVEDRGVWRQMILCGDPLMGEAERRRRRR